VVGVAELLTLPADEAALALTFDDAFVNFAALAWPLLRDHGLPATLYVPTSHVGGTNAWGGVAEPGIPQLEILDWDALARLAEEGVVLGSHTCTHPRLAALPAAAARDEMERSAEEMTFRLGKRPAGLAYPYGSCSPAVAAAAGQLFDHACTTDLRPIGSAEDCHRLPRLDTYYLRKDGMLEAWGRSRLRIYLRARAGARRCRSLLAEMRHA
jgi:peptidoglycan/xylan/chitin deacetylase (PgdA/CDA1 family)